MIIPFLSMWERTAGRASSKAPDWQPVTITVRATGRAVRTRAFLPPRATFSEMGGGVEIEGVVISAWMVAEDVRRLETDDQLLDAGGRLWHVVNPLYKGNGLCMAVLREGASATPIVRNPERC